MSDLLVPWEIIVKRVEAAALGDYVTVIYNPASKKRIHQLKDTKDIFLKYRKPDTPVAIVKGAFRDSQKIVATPLDKLLDYNDMLATGPPDRDSTRSLFVKWALELGMVFRSTEYELVPET